MCGIVGCFERNRAVNENVLRRMTNSLAHRGPDDFGLTQLSEVSGGGSLGLGHQRLSIIDLSPGGHQPMRYKHLTVVFNGEIFNYKTVREKLMGYGYSFATDSDTEVILIAFFHWGLACVSEFRGMWAFAIWDANQQKVFLCRDRMGVKPLYWYRKGDVFLFASELKAFHEHPSFEKELDSEACSLYFRYSYIPAPFSIFKHAKKLNPGTYLIVDSELNMREETYWEMDRYFAQGAEEKRHWLSRSEDEVVDELEEVLTDAFKLRMVADVPVGMFLSGGIDSSLVTALLQKDSATPLKTFTIGFHEKKYNEAEWAKKVALHLGTDHTELYCSPAEAFNVIERLPTLYDEPFGDSSAIPTFLVSQLARRSVTVALSADGGDEQFCGYPRYLKVKRIHDVPYSLRKGLGTLLSYLPPVTFSRAHTLLGNRNPRWNNLEDKYSKMVIGLTKRAPSSQFDVLKSYFQDHELLALGMNASSRWAPQPWKETDVVTELMRIDLHYSLIDDMLVKVDRASMAVGLESREPFLDNRVLEYSSRMPIEWKFRDGKTKYILRKILYRYVPQHLVDRKKMGFEVPIHTWFKNELKPVYQHYLDGKRLRQTGVFNATYVEELVRKYFRGDLVDANKLWLLCNFEMWREKWM